MLSFFFPAASFCLCQHIVYFVRSTILFCLFAVVGVLSFCLLWYVACLQLLQSEVVSLAVIVV